MADYAVQLQNINKSFGVVQVLKDVTVEIRKGEIHALLGENGAGKSTLMNILGGIYRMDSGKMLIMGEGVDVHSPAQSQENGVAFIHQELNVINDLMVYENMFLGHELKNWLGHLDSQAMCDRTCEIFKSMNVEIDPKAMVRDLQASYKQLIEIGKALLRSAKIIIMDEPTTSLTEEEVNNVFLVMKSLTQKGTTIIFISHKLGEVVNFCDSYTILRNGEKIVDGKTVKQEKKVTTEELAKFMVGKDVLGVDVYEPHNIGENILKVDEICVGNELRKVSFQLAKGEILGFTGLLGDGKEVLARALFGDVKTTGGTVRKSGQIIKIKSPEQAKKFKVGYLPDNRKENSIIKDLSVRENATIATFKQFCNGPLINHKKERKLFCEYKEKLNIKVVDSEQLITSLSGGNQQKVMIAKWMNVKPDIMIFSNPTQGVDVGAKNEIYSLIFELAKQGVGVIIMSGETEEIMKLCDRIIVMYHGVVKGELVREEITQESIMILSTGGSLTE